VASTVADAQILAVALMTVADQAWPAPSRAPRGTAAAGADVGVMVVARPPHRRSRRLPRAPPKPSTAPRAAEAVADPRAAAAAAVCRTSHERSGRGMK
jgi:hypothetical protein